MKNRKKKKKSKKLLKLKITLIVIAAAAVSFTVVFIIGVVSAVLCASNNQNKSQETASNNAETINEDGNFDNIGVSKNLVKFIESWEGFGATGYRGLDSWNVTIGYGHVEMPGESFTTLTKDEGENLLLSDLKKDGFVTFVNKKFSDCDLKQNQKDALVSLAYNIGTGNWDNLNLTADIKRHADNDTIRTDFEAICHVGGIKSEGLLKRRYAEWVMYSQGEYMKHS